MKAGIEFPKVATRSVHVPCGETSLAGELAAPASARGIVLFVHGSGSSRHSPRNRAVAQSLNRSGFATLLFDLLTAEEETRDLETAELRFDIAMLSDRVLEVVDWIREQPETRSLSIGLFGASTGAAAARVAAAERPNEIAAVVSRGGRPDLADAELPSVSAPTLLIVGGLDKEVIKLNEQALALLRCEKELRIVPGATHLFEEPGTLERVAALARAWFLRHLVGPMAPTPKLT